MNGSGSLREEVENISNKLYQDYKSLEELIYVIRNTFCTLSLPEISSLGDPKKTLFECLDEIRLLREQSSSEIGERVLKINETQEGQEYLKNTKVSDLLQNSYDSFIIRDVKTKMFEIEPEPVSYLELGSSIKNLLHDHLKKSIARKVERRQLEGKTNPLLAVHLQWVITEYYSSKVEGFGYKELEELGNLINGVFKEKQEKEILGVILIKETLDGADFIPNSLIRDPNKIAKIDSLLKKLNIEKKKSKKEVDEEAKVLEKKKKECISKMLLNRNLVEEFKLDYKEGWNKNQEFLKRFLKYVEMGDGRGIRFVRLDRLYKEDFLDSVELAECLDKKKALLRNSNFLDSFDIKHLPRSTDAMLFVRTYTKIKIEKHLLSEINKMFNEDTDKEITVKDLYSDLKKLIGKDKEYSLFYNWDLGKKITQIPDIKRDPQEGIAYLEINNSKVHLCLDRIENSLLFEKDSFILEQFKEGYEGRKEPFVVEVEEFKDKKEIQDIIKSNDQFKTEEDVKQRVKIRIAEKFNIKRSNGASFVRLKV